MSVDRFSRHVRPPNEVAAALCEESRTFGSSENSNSSILTKALPLQLAATEAREALRKILVALDGGTPPVASHELDFATLILNYEMYSEKIDEEIAQSAAKNLLRKAYYAVRPALPVAVRKHLQRTALRKWRTISFPSWPVDTTTERIWGELWKRAFLLLGQKEIPFVWYWPDGYRACGVMTHDVETEAGRDFCSEIMKMEARFDIRSAFEVVPEVRYEVPLEFLQSIRERGCEVCVHGLNHDGRLFSARTVFDERKDRIHQYASKWGAVGFRSPVLYRQLEWLQELGFSYDMSVPNVGHLDPQRGGCCTVMPYFLGDMVELPLTTIQDYSLYHVLNECSLVMWKRQASVILDHCGFISFIIHPDYNIDQKYQALYEELLNYLAILRGDAGVWLALPREVDEWWRTRDQMEVVRDKGSWVVTGPQSDRARIAFARIVDDKVMFQLAE